MEVDVPKKSEAQSRGTMVWPGMPQELPSLRKGKDESVSQGWPLKMEILELPDDDVHFDLQKMEILDKMAWGDDTL